MTKREKELEDLFQRWMKNREKRKDGKNYCRRT